MAGGDPQRSSLSDRRRLANNEMDSVLKIPSGLRSWPEDFSAETATVERGAVPLAGLRQRLVQAGPAR